MKTPDGYMLLDPIDICDNDYSKANYEKLVNKIGYYEDLEEKGLLLRLPCRMGDTVWFVGNDFVNDYEIRRFIVDETGINWVQIAKEIDGRDYWDSFSICDIGKTVFLTKEEAEQALEQMKAGAV